MALLSGTTEKASQTTARVARKQHEHMSSLNRWVLPAISPVMALVMAVA